jgi:hypothetical protein
MKSMDFLQEWQVLLIPLAVAIITQFAKVLIESRKIGFHWGHMNSYGGMPSSHTALSVSITLTVGLTTGFTSPLFAVTAFVAAVFIRDAVGIRYALGFHGKVLNHLIETLPEDIRTTFPKHLEDRLGHRPIEALVGALLGTICTLGFYWLLNGLA